MSNSLWKNNKRDSRNGMVLAKGAVKQETFQTIKHVMSFSMSRARTTGCRQGKGQMRATLHCIQGQITLRWAKALQVKSEENTSTTTSQDWPKWDRVVHTTDLSVQEAEEGGCKFKASLGVARKTLSQKEERKWKKIHLCGYVVYVCVFIHPEQLKASKGIVLIKKSIWLCLSA